MASCKTEKTWSDLQESLNRVRQQLGLVPRTGWNDLVPSDAYLRAHLTSQHNRRKVHSPSYLPRLLITSDGVHNGPSADLRRGLRVVVPPLLNEKANGREEGPRNAVNSGFQQPGNRLKRTDSPDYAMIRPADLPLQNVLSMSPYGGDKESSRTLSQSPGRERQFAACSFFRENKSFAWNFVDSFISEVLRDELVPDALMEVLSGVYTKCPPVYSLTKKNSYIQSKLQQITELDVLKQRPAVSVLDTLLKEIVGELTVRVIRSAVKELVKEAVSEMILEGILQDEILPSVLDEETRNVAVLLLSEYHTEISEQQQEEVRTYASRRLIDMLLLENLMKIIGSEGRAFSEKVELDRLLDSWMLDVFFGQYFNISRHNHVTVENVALRDYHQKAFTDVVLDVILTEMSEHVDQDLADLSQYEQEMEEADFTVD
ncbi:uncharacterized protein [Heptranchias perlo]|uniref:uncharacterized protein isoform X2 n=1 Tax=Heptranchias perlo TaxID=212740 RepID=UPI00355A519F